MASSVSSVQGHGVMHPSPIKQHIESEVDELMLSLPDPECLSSDQQRGIIARYAAVLEGNFIYWMTATLLSVKSLEARSIIVDNLLEEIKDCHPGMMRRFAMAANASPTEADSLAVHEGLGKVRLFLGRLSPVQNLVTMAFFEGFIQRFMAYLADLAQRRSSSDFEYTDVHGICDVAHTQELFRALAAEMVLDPPDAHADLFEGTELLRNLIRTIVCANGQPALRAMAQAN